MLDGAPALKDISPLKMKFSMREEELGRLGTGGWSRVRGEEPQVRNHEMRIRRQEKEDQ